MFPESWFLNTSASSYQFKDFKVPTQTVKHLPAMRETWVRFLGREDTLEKEMATHSSTFAWKIPWTEEPGMLQSVGLQRVGHDWATSLSLKKLRVREGCLKNSMGCQVNFLWKYWLETLREEIIGLQWIYRLDVLCGVFFFSCLLTIAYLQKIFIFGRISSEIQFHR